MAAVTVCSDFGTQENKSLSLFPLFPHLFAIKSGNLIYSTVIIINDTHCIFTRLDETQAGIKIAGRNINNLRYAHDTSLMAESKEELKKRAT